MILKEAIVIKMFILFHKNIKVGDVVIKTRYHEINTIRNLFFSDHTKQLYY